MTLVDSAFLLAAEGQVDESKCGPTVTEAESGGLSTDAVVGISIGCIILVVIIVAALYWVRNWSFDHF